MLKVVINAPAALSGAPTGVGRYTGGLVRGLADLADPDLDLFVYGDSAGGRLAGGPVPGTTLGRLWHEHRGLARRVRGRAADILHNLRSTVPSGLSVPAVITVFDCFAWRSPEDYDWWWRAYWRPRVGAAVRRATRIIAISRTTAEDLHRHLGVPPERVDVVPCGVESCFRPQPAAEVEDCRRRLDLPAEFLFYLGLIFPRKNLVRLMEAMLRLPHAPPLLVAGPRDEAGERGLREAATRLGLADRVRFLGFVSDQDLPRVYAAASCLAYPSTHEGFGFPVLEAIACGAPVLTSRDTVMADTVGEAAVLVDPRSVDSMAAGLERVLSDGDLRARLRQAGPARAAEFRWERIAERTVQVYRRAAGRP